MSTFELGQRVRYKRTLHRTYRDGRKMWESHEWGDKFPNNPHHNGEGIVIGLRTLSNGTVDYTEESASYRATESFPAVVISYGLRRKPVLVRPEHVRPVTASGHDVAVTVPSVPYGPEGVPAAEADASYYRDAARNIRFQASRGRAFAGSNVTETVARLCDAVATALRNPKPTDSETGTTT